MNKIRLTESQLHNIIKESVNEVLSELDWKTYRNAGKKARSRGDDRETVFNFKSADQFADDFGYHERSKGTDPNIHYKHVFPETDDDDGYINSICAWRSDGPENKPDWMRYDYDGKLKREFGLVPPRYCWTRDKDEFFNKGKEDNAFRGAFDRATSEWDNYRKGKYEYIKGVGWRKKRDLNESIRKAIRKVLR